MPSMDALKRRLGLSKKATGTRGSSGDIQKKAEEDMRRRSADAANKSAAASRPPGKAFITPGARLDTSQVQDRRVPPKQSEQDMMMLAEGRADSVGSTDVRRPYNGPVPMGALFRRVQGRR